VSSTPAAPKPAAKKDPAPTSTGPQSKPQPGPQHVDRAELDRLLHGHHHDPHTVLGPHAGPEGVTLRVLRPWRPRSRPWWAPSGTS
jgi:1,4-alpha-glucan branching enzyme